MPGHPDWFGTPLVGGFDQVFNQDLLIPAGGSISQYIQFAKPGYIVNLNPTYNAASGANPFVRVHWQWEDANPAVVDTGYQRWTLPVVASGVYNPIIGSGPVRGKWLQVRMDNLDVAQPLLVGLALYETTQHIARDDWRNANIFNAAIAPGQTAAPGADMATNRLASFAVTVAVNTQYALPLYSGQAWISAAFHPVAGGNTGFQVGSFIVPGDLYDSPTTTTSTVVEAVPVTLPREPCFILLIPPPGGGFYDVAITAMEYVS